jgi:ParB-like chromosome segregation protein Spo0J
MAKLENLLNKPAREDRPGFAVTMIHYSKLYPSRNNNYSLENIQELANMILLSGEVKQNLVARKKAPDEYELIAGHRRRLAVKYLVEERGLERFAMVPVHLEKSDDVRSELNLILINAGARERSDYEKMNEVARLTELLQALQTGTEEDRELFREVSGQDPALVGGRELRKIIAEKLGLGETKTANLKHIHSKLSPELKEHFRDGTIGISAANEAAGLPPEEQRELAEQDKISMEDVRRKKEKSVSESDTEPEEALQVEGQMSMAADFSEYMPQPQRSEVPEPEIKNLIEPEIRRQYCEAFARKLITTFKDWFLEDFHGRVTDVCNSEVELKKRFIGTWYFSDPVIGGGAHINLFTDYIQIWSRDGQCLGNAEWFYLCAAIQSMWNIVSLENAAKMQQNEPEHCENSSEEDTPTPDTEPEEPIEYDRKTLLWMIGELTELLEQMREYWIQNQPHTYTKHAMQLQAYKNLLADMDKADQEPEAEQPELPLMKNNDQRKEWLRDYKSWGLWYTDEHIGCRYYKYDFDNGARLIAEEYSANNEVTKNDFVFSYLHLIGGPEPTRHSKYGFGKWTRHETYSRFPNSETELVEFLKEIQKGEK